MDFLICVVGHLMLFYLKIKRSLNMKNTVYIRKKKEDKPVVAICYDFDKTLTHDDMQAQGFIQSVGLSVKDFWKKSNGLALKNGMDQNLAYMYSMCHESYGNVALTKDLLLKYGSKIKLFPGVDTWFERIRRYGEEKDVIVEHYIISSGLKEMIEGTDIAGNEVFEKIYASEFFYEETAVGEIPVWPAQVVNYTNKTQFLFRIEKGVLDINDPGVNDYYPPDKLRVPFSNMIYIGDSDTDIPCMRLVRERGGSSIGVYNPEKGKEKVYKMMREHRVDYFAPADYTEFGELDDIVKAVIDKISGSEPLIKMALANQKEALQAREKCTKEGVKSVYHNDLIINLENSRSKVDIV